MFAMWAWTTLDWRLAEAAADSIGLETALTWPMAIKGFTICILVGLITDIFGFA